MAVGETKIAGQLTGYLCYIYNGYCYGAFYQRLLLAEHSY